MVRLACFFSMFLSFGGHTRRPAKNDPQKMTHTTRPSALHIQKRNGGNRPPNNDHGGVVSQSNPMHLTMGMNGQAAAAAAATHSTGSDIFAVKTSTSSHTLRIFLLHYKPTQKNHCLYRCIFSPTQKHNVSAISQRRCWSWQGEEKASESYQRWWWCRYNNHNGIDR